MTSGGHKIGGYGAALLAFSTVSHVSVPVAIGTTLGVIAGARAPDWMEMRVIGPIRLIPHRTVTHWFAPWLAASIGLVAALLAGQPFILAIPLGFCLGALLHISGDWMTPMGIPALNPKRRTSLRVGASGGPAEALWLLMIWVPAVGAAYVATQGDFL